MINNMINVVKLEDSSGEELSYSSTKSKPETTYIGDQKKLRLFKVRLDKTLTEQCAFQFSFDSDRGELFIVDEKRYFPIESSIFKTYKGCINKLVSFFNRRREDKIVTLFEDDAFIKVPKCHAEPATLISALKETVNKIEEVKQVFKHEDSDALLLLVRVFRKGVKNWKESDGIIVLKFEENFRTNEVKIKRLLFCH